MKISIIIDTPLAWQSGIWFHRNETPMKALAMRGHGVNQIVLKHPENSTDPYKQNKMTEAEMSFPDTVIFGRTYPAAYDPIQVMKDYKRRGKRVLYDMDDDFWMVAKSNPSLKVSNALKDQYEGQIREADAIITPSLELAKKFRKHFKKPVFICPNGIDFELYKPRKHDPNQPLTIGYMGAASHWNDLGDTNLMEALEELYKKHDFVFNVYGLTGDSIEAAMYMHRKMLEGNYQPENAAYFSAALNFWEKLQTLKGRHTPFMPPEIHPFVLSNQDFDIAVAPLELSEFNKGKSNIKFYEYAAVETITLASDVPPYSEEVSYRAKNTKKDWYNKLEKLIIDKPFRDKLQKQQTEWVKKHRSLEAIGLPWELACQLPGGLKVLNQQ